MGRSLRRPVPLLVTLDLEVAPDHDLEEQRLVLPRLQEDLARLGLPVTVFTTTPAAELFEGEVGALAAAGHEIACHGLDHGPADNYAHMPGEEVNRRLARATAVLTRVVGTRPRCFRGPFMSTSVPAQRALMDQGYVADFSVCSGRLDVWGSRGGHPGWFTAPRSSYHPHPLSPFRRGEEPLVVVPLRCVGVPFSSGTLFLAGLRATLALGELLLAESRLTGAPLVFLFHSYELTSPVGVGREEGGSRPPTRPLHKFYRHSRPWRYRALMALLQHLARGPGVVPMTGASYVKTLSTRAPVSMRPGKYPCIRP